MTRFGIALALLAAMVVIRWAFNRSARELGDIAARRRDGEDWPC